MSFTGSTLTKLHGKPETGSRWKLSVENSSNMAKHCIFSILLNCHRMWLSKRLNSNTLMLNGSSALTKLKQNNQPRLTSVTAVQDIQTSFNEHRPWESYCQATPKYSLGKKSIFFAIFSVRHPLNWSLDLFFLSRGLCSFQGGTIESYLKGWWYSVLYCICQLS